MNARFIAIQESGPMINGTETIRNGHVQMSLIALYQKLLSNFIAFDDRRQVVNIRFN